MNAGRAFRSSICDLPGYCALALALVQAIAPIIWMLSGSLTREEDFLVSPWKLPASPQFGNYTLALGNADITNGLWNSLTVVFLGILLLGFCAGTTAYALARFTFHGKSAVTGLILFTMMMPPDVLTVPLFITLRSLGLLGTLPGLACLYASSAFGMTVFLLRSYFLAIPLEIEDAGRLDGASVSQVLRHIVIPIASPGFASVMAIQAMGMWNDLYLALVFVHDPALATAPVGLLAFFQRDSIDWPLLLAALTLLTVPVLLLFALLQKRITAGFVSGGVK